jgi:EAL domain-containing protein (putative c-di-GMP-specific phosphodiesterase class I)/GGDEF domain-containing protein
VVDLLDRAALDMVFQPIVDLQAGDVTGYEALSRPHADTGFDDPVALFAAAEVSGCLPALEALARRIAFAAASSWPASMTLFLNNSPPTFLHESFGPTLQGEVDSLKGLEPRRIVLEITEHAAIDLEHDVGARSADLRGRGFQMAIDDVGAGVNGLNQITFLRPNWIKLDRQLIAEIDFDPVKQNLIRFFVHFARLSDMRIVAEGIERREELAVLMRLGVTHGQGFYLARPGAGGAGLDQTVLDVLDELHREADKLRFQDVGAMRVESLATPVATCPREMTVAEAIARLRLHTSPQGVAVLDGRRFAGWLDRDRLESLAAAGETSKQLGDQGLIKCPLIGTDATLAEAMEVMASHLDQQRPAPLAVIGQGVVAGVIMLPQLLMAAAESHRRSPARMASLTGLPTRVQADQWIARRIQVGDPSSVAIIDLRDFDAYNLAYGFEMGDALLMQLVGLVHRYFIDGEEPPADFVAHLGEDRFLVSCRDEAEHALLDLVEQFEMIRGDFFSTLDRASGSFHCTDASGRRHTYPMTSLRVVLIPHAFQRARTPRELYRLATEVRMRRRGPEGTARIITDERAHRAAQRESA